MRDKNILNSASINKSIDVFIQCYYDIVDIKTKEKLFLNFKNVCKSFEEGYIAFDIRDCRNMKAKSVVYKRNERIFEEIKKTSRRRKLQR